MLEVERKDFYSDTETRLDMHVLSRNLIKNFATKAYQFSGLYSLPFISSSPLKNRAVTVNLCNARRYISEGDETISSEKSLTSSQNLLRFPVPPLSETLEKFLKTAEVHLTKEELAETYRATQSFQTGIGAKLQSILENVANAEDNWLAKRWLQNAYMRYRDPVTVFSSPGMAFPVQQFKSDEEFVSYAAKITYAALAYKDLINKNKIPVEKMGKLELDMSQYKKVFGTCRIPNMHEDRLVYNPKSKHIVVIHKNHFLKIPVYCKSGEILHPDQIAAHFLCIVRSNEPPAVPVGILTTDCRDNWSEAYQELIDDFQNKRSVADIQKALFTVCLDEEVPINHGVNDKCVVSDQLIHGGGAHHNAGNRWMDKTIQIVVNRNGVNGLCYEHSPAEGQPIAIMTDFILNCWNSGQLEKSGVPADDYPLGYRLPFKISNKLQSYIDNASLTVNKLSKDLEMDVLHYTCYGREFIKSQKLSPDSYIQMAMQYAFFKLHKTPGAQYESAHLRIYYNGRTETIRSCSVESISWACSMLSDCPDEERIARLKKAINSHRDYTKMALEGKGVDRHLLGLKLMAIEQKMDIPEFFQNPGVAKSAHFRMSTSQVASKHLAFMCYGPLVDNGYGCCYNPRSNDMLFAISSWKSNEETSSIAFKKAMCEALNSMYELLNRAGEKPKSKL